MGSFDAFSWFIFIIIVVLAVVFFLGKGDGVMTAFDRNRPVVNRSPEDEKRYQRSIGIFLVVLAGADLLMTLLGRVSFIFIIIALAIVVIDIVMVTRYLRKNFPEDRV